MTGSPQTGRAAADLFEQLAARLLSQPHVEQGTGFRRMPGLRTNKRIFAMLCRGELVVKLPRARVDELVAAGAAMRFEPRRDGRLMKEWATLPEEQNHNWEPLAREALQFVSVAT
jgi:hypothetical protein